MSRLRTLFFILAFWAIFPLNLSATDLQPQSANVGVSSLSFTWTNIPSESYNAVISTESSFASAISSQTLSPNATTYTNLNPNTTYYFEVKLSTETDADYIPNRISTVTYAAAPSDLYSQPDFFTAESSGNAVASIGWNVNGNPEYTDYLIEISTGSLPNSFTGNLSVYREWPPVALSGLIANTTHYFRAKAVNINGIQTAFSSQISTSTLALSLKNIQVFVYETSSTFKWDALSGANQAESSNGYRIIMSSSPDFSGQLTPWETSNNAVSSNTMTGLFSNTTYYYKIGSLNQNNAPNFTQSYLTTLTLKPQNFQLISIADLSAAFGWTAFPPSPSSYSATGYALEASSTNFNGTGIIHSSTTYDISLSTLTLATIDANTTYYFRVGALNKNLTPNYSSIISSVTLALPIIKSMTTTTVSSTTITVGYPNHPLAPQNMSCDGYILDASSRPFGTGAVVYSSTTLDNQLNVLKISNLWPSTTYYMKIATLNISKTPNYTTLNSTITSLPEPLSSAPITGIWESSATVAFSSVASNGYVIEASTWQYFNYVYASSFTSNSSAASITITGLDPNTEYYFRFGPVFNGATSYSLTSPSQKSTLSKPVSGQSFYNLYYSSITVGWTPLPSSPQKDTAEYYLLETSLLPDFSSILYSSATADISLDRLTIQNLIPNTSYYFRVGAANWDDVKNYVYTPATSTLANQPIQTAFSGLTTGEMTINWNSNSNPPDTAYLLQISSNSGFSAPVFSSNTTNTYASFSSLVPNTTYYIKAAAYNRLGVPTGPFDFSPMATLAFDPVASPYSSLGVSSVTLNWGRGLNPPDVTYYLAQISSTAFADAIFSSTTLTTSATFYGLIPNTSYYLRISALNHTSVPTIPVSLGTALTLPTTPYILATEQAFTNYLMDGFTLNWQSNGNSPVTIYNVEASTRSDFGIINSSGSTTALFFSFKDLSFNTTYWTRIQAQGQSELQTPFIESGATQTLLYSQDNALYDKDSTISLNTSYGTISVFSPAGAFGGTTKIKIEPEISFAPPVSPTAILRPTGIGVKITYFPIVLQFKALTIKIPYKISQIPQGIDRAKLSIASYDETNKIWTPLPSASDVANNLVTAQTWHLSTFQIMEITPQNTLDSIKVFPNPYTPSSVTSVMRFTNMTSYAKVKIYTLLGELVRELSSGADGTTYWDGKNDAGREAASGVYIALIQTQDKKSKKIIKIAVQK